MEKTWLQNELGSLDSTIKEIMDGCNCTEEQANHLLARSYAIADYIVDSRTRRSSEVGDSTIA